MKLSLPVVQHPRTCGVNSRKQGMAAAHRVILGILAEADSPLETHSAPGTFSDFQKNKRFWQTKMSSQDEKPKLPFRIPSNI